MTTEELLKRVKLIELKSKRRINSLFLGEYHSTFKGTGITFSEVRAYQFGDDVRKIDWNKTAQFNEPFIKIFEEEREVTSMILVDISGSMNFGTQKQFKNEAVAEISAILALSALKSNDKVGLILYSDRIEAYLPPKKGNLQAVKIIKTILEAEPQKKQANLKVIIDFLLKTIHRKATIFIISDFDNDSSHEGIGIISRKHELIGIRIFDKIEEKFPDIGIVYMQDLETNKQQWVNTSSSLVREQYSKHYLQLFIAIKNSFIKNRAGFINISTNSDYAKVLLNYFKSQHK